MSRQILSKIKIKNANLK
uniref:Uncharacterized protein n=1 Tax=Anguilla anguilla TaxID=7936 RepID=A0A0E9P9M5_ANGAN